MLIIRLFFYPISSTVDVIVLVVVIVVGVVMAVMIHECHHLLLSTRMIAVYGRVGVAGVGNLVVIADCIVAVGLGIEVDIGSVGNFG